MKDEKFIDVPGAATFQLVDMGINSFEVNTLLTSVLREKEIEKPPKKKKIIINYLKQPKSKNLTSKKKKQFIEKKRKKKKSRELGSLQG